jgi:hypothetical protein
MKNNAVPLHDKLITLRVPASAWKVLRETLSIDARSSAFDSVLRKQIGNALGQINELSGAHIIDFGNSESVFASALDLLSREGYQAMINGSKSNVRMLKVEEDPANGDRLVVVNGEGDEGPVTRIPVSDVSFLQV